MMQRGVNNIKAKLTEEDVLAIYDDTSTTQEKLGQRYGVAQETINHIKKGRSWRYLTKHGL